MAAAVQDVRVNHGRLHVAVPEQLLYGTDIVPGFQQMRGETVAERVGANWLGDSRRSGRLVYRALRHRLVQVKLSSGLPDICPRRQKYLEGLSNICPATQKCRSARPEYVWMPRTVVQALVTICANAPIG